VGGPAYTIEAVGTIPATLLGETAQIAVLLDGAQVIGESAPLTGKTDTRWLSDQGVYAASGISINALAGVVIGCIYVRDHDYVEGDPHYPEG